MENAYIDKIFQIENDPMSNTISDSLIPYDMAVLKLRKPVNAENISSFSMNSTLNNVNASGFRCFATDLKQFDMEGKIAKLMNAKKSQFKTPIKSVRSISYLVHLEAYNNISYRGRKVIRKDFLKFLAAPPRFITHGYSGGPLWCRNYETGESTLNGLSAAGLEFGNLEYLIAKLLSPKDITDIERFMKGDIAPTHKFKNSPSFSKLLKTNGYTY